MKRLSLGMARMPMVLGPVFFLPLYLWMYGICAGVSIDVVWRIRNLNVIVVAVSGGTQKVLWQKVLRQVPSALLTLYLRAYYPQIRSTVLETKQCDGKLAVTFPEWYLRSNRKGGAV
jgi:hypothetical protein